MKPALKTVLVCLLLSACMGPEEASESAKQAVEAAGFSEVRMVEPIILGCDQNDAYRWRWEGVNVAGRKVRGQVCAGMWFKAWTVRLER